MALDNMSQAALQTANEAIRMATVVQTQLGGHENACGRRYEDWRAQSARTEKSIESMHEKIDQKIGGVYKILWGTSATTIVLLLSALSAVVFYILTLHKG